MVSLWRGTSRGDILTAPAKTLPGLLSLIVVSPNQIGFLFFVIFFLFASHGDHAFCLAERAERESQCTIFDGEKTTPAVAAIFVDICNPAAPVPG